MRGYVPAPYSVMDHEKIAKTSMRDGWGIIAPLHDQCRIINSLELA